MASVQSVPTIPIYLDRQIARILLRAAEDPGDVRRLLERLAAALELLSSVLSKGFGSEVGAQRGIVS